VNVFITSSYGATRLLGAVCLAMNACALVPAAPVANTAPRNDGPASGIHRIEQIIGPASCSNDGECRIIGVGALASQLGAVTVSSVPDERSGEVGGLQNTVTNLGASIGTALAGAVLIATLTTSVAAGIQSNPAVPAQVKSAAEVQLSSGVAFISDADLEKALEDAGVPDDAATAIKDENADARLAALRQSLSILAVIALLALLFSVRIPREQPASASSV